MVTLAFSVSLGVLPARAAALQKAPSFLMKPSPTSALCEPADPGRGAGGGAESLPGDALIGGPVARAAGPG
jgi:hypothetical protein